MSAYPEMTAPRSSVALSYSAGGARPKIVILSAELGELACHPAKRREGLPSAGGWALIGGVAAQEKYISCPQLAARGVAAALAGGG